MYKHKICVNLTIKYQTIKMLFVIYIAIVFAIVCISKDIEILFV